MKSPFRKPEQAHVDVDMLSAYLDNQVTPAERVRVEGHLANCVACRGELDGLRQTVALLQALPRVPVPRAFTLSEAQVGIRRSEPRPAWGSVLRGLGAVTAIALVAVVAVSLLNRPSWQPAATVARTMPAAASVEPSVQPAAPAAEAPAEALAKAPVQAPAPAPVQPTATALPAVKRTTVAADTTAPTEAAPAALAPKPAVSAQGAAPTEAPAAKVVATEAPSLMAAAAAAPAPQGTPSVGVMASGRSVGGGVSAAGMPVQAQSPEPTPALAQPESVLPAAAGFAYADEKGLWTVDGKSGVRQLVASEGITLPIISADRSRVAYRITRGDQSELWTIRWDGTDAGLLLDERELPTSGLPAGYTERRFNDVRWLPERNLLAVTTVAVPGSADLLPRLELWHLNAESGALQYVADMGRAYRPFYSPNGTQFALLQYGTKSDPTGDLMLANADGSDAREVLRFPAGPTTSSSDSQIAWLPDASSLWTYIPDPSTSSEPGDNPAVGGAVNGATLYRVSATGGDAKSAGRVDGFQVFWSQDGSRLAYTRAGKDGALDLFLAKADGSNPQFYASLGNGGFTNWSPDGTHFIYTDGVGQTYVGAPDQAPQLLGRSMSLFDPRWISPRQILALHDTGTNWLLVERTLDGAPTDGGIVGMQPLPREVTYDVTKP